MKSNRNYIIALCVFFAFVFGVYHYQSSTFTQEVATPIIQDATSIQQTDELTFNDYSDATEEQKSLSIKKESDASQNFSIKKDIKIPSIQPSLRENIIQVLKQAKFTKNHNPATIYIVIDDFGYQLRKVDLFLTLPEPITFSILPNLPQSNIIATKLHNQNQVTLLHLPMEPKINTKLEKITLLVRDNEIEVLEKIQKSSNTVPFYYGINNHMGSAFTTNSQSMSFLMKHLKEQNLFFLDSKTASGRLSLEVARKYGVPYLSRDIFLDNSKNSIAIAKQLVYAAKIAFRKGESIAIGHPYNNTHQVLRILMPMLVEEGILFETLDKKI